MPEHGSVAVPLLGASTCLTETYEGAWRRGHESVGSQHMLLALVAQGDPISSSAFVQAGVAFSRLISLFPQASLMVDSSDKMSGRTAEPEVNRMLRQAAAIPRPWFLLRLLTALAGKPITDHPKHPRPQWTANARAILGSALDAAAVSGRVQPCRAELAVALLAQQDSSAVRILAELGVSRDDLRQEITDRYGSGRPRPLYDFDLDRRSAAHVLRILLCSDLDELPGHAESPFWSSGRYTATMHQVAALAVDRGVENPGEDHVFLGLLATYEEMAVDGLQFGPGWEACFPAGKVLVESGMSFRPSGDQGSKRDEKTELMVQATFKVKSIFRSGFAELRQLFGPNDSRVSNLRTEALLLADAGVDRDQLRDRLKAALTV